MAKRWISFGFVLFIILIGGAGIGFAFGRTGAGSPAQLAAGIGTAFTYQGSLENGGIPVDMTCDLFFSLYDDPGAGDPPVGGTLLGTDEHLGVDVKGGIFTVELDFGVSAFAGEARYLDIQVRCPTNQGNYTPLGPRQTLTPAPYALFAGNTPWDGLLNVPAGFADNLDNDTQYQAGIGLVLNGPTFDLSTVYRLPQGCEPWQVPAWDPDTSSWDCISAVLDLTPSQKVPNSLEINPSSSPNQGVAPPIGKPIVDLSGLGTKFSYSIGQLGQINLGLAEISDFDIICQDPCPEVNDWHRDSYIQQGGYLRDVNVIILDRGQNEIQRWAYIRCWVSQVVPELSPDGHKAYLRYTVVCEDLSTTFNPPAPSSSNAIIPVDKSTLSSQQATVQPPPQQVPHFLDFQGVFNPLVGEVQVDLGMVQIQTDKVAVTPNGNIQTYIPGNTHFGTFDVVCIQYCDPLDVWFQDALGGMVASADGLLQVLDATLTPVLQWDLTNCTPFEKGTAYNDSGSELFLRYRMVCESYELLNGVP